MNYPKISVITPNYNGAAYLEQTILSVLGQNYPNLEYIIIDGGSQDDSKSIIEKYDDRLAYWCSESDQGLYYAVQKGFERATGDILTWLNSDDLFHKGALLAVAEIFQLGEIHWLSGTPNLIDEMGRSVEVDNFSRWSKYRFRLENKFIQQEGTFWSRALWEKSGASLDLSYRYAADFELWNRFFNYEKLFACNILLGSFRLRGKNQVSFDHWDLYQSEMKQIVEDNPFSREDLTHLNKIKQLMRWRKLIEQSKLLNLQSFHIRINSQISKLYDYPPVIRFNRVTQSYYLHE
ncbi:MAG: glycosyltransferase family 2 protein [Bacteroidales bacterium]